MNTKKINKIKSLDEDTFKQIFILYYPKMKRFLSGFIDDEMLVEDMVQDLFTYIWESRASLKIENVNAYLYQSARNLLYKHWTQLKNKTENIDQIPEPISTNDIEELIYKNELLENIYTELNKLPSKRKNIFVMSRLSSLSNNEIASKLNLSVRTVETQIYFTLKTLKKNLKIFLLLLFALLLINEA